MLNTRSLIFFIGAGGLTALLHLYLYRRLIHDTTTNARWRRVGWVASLALWLAFLLSRVLQAVVFPSSRTTPLFAATWLWAAVVSYLVLALAALGFLRGLLFLPQRIRALWRGEAAVQSPERRLFLSRAVAGGAVALAGGLTPYGVWRAFEAPEISNVVVRLPGLPRTLDGFTIVQLTDLHISSVLGRKFLEELVRRTNSLKPDLVAVTGDLVDGRVRALGHTVAALQDLRSRHGTYFVTGNHDYYSGDREWCAALETMGINVMRNRRVSIGDAGGSFDLIGVDDWGARHRLSTSGYDLQRAMRGRDPSRAAVLLAHEPANFEEAVAQGIGLQLSGHTHGGQFFPVTWLVPLRWPRYAGLYEHQSGKLYVSRGTGFWGPPLRVGSPPEVVRVTLTA